MKTNVNITATNVYSKLHFLKFALFGIIGILTMPILLAQAPAIEWEQNYGGSGQDLVPFIKQTAEGGYIMAGRTTSSDGDVGGNNGILNCWVVKIDALGGIEWEQNYGGSQVEFPNAIEQTVDGGYIFAAVTSSNNGDASGNNGGQDFWVVKINSTGGIEWEQNYGGSENEQPSDLQQTADGGYIVVGFTFSNDIDVTGQNGDGDFWVLKLDVTGGIEWQKTLGGSLLDSAGAVKQTPDNGYIVTGSSRSSDGDVSGNKGENDVWVVKLDNLGNIQWEQNYGGSGADYPLDLILTTDGGYVFVGSTASTDGDVSFNNGGQDIWVVKLDALGVIQWEKTFGGSGNEWGRSIEQTVDGGFVLVGATDSTDGDLIDNNLLSLSYWVVKLDAAGNLVWQRTLGGSNSDSGISIAQTQDTGFIVAGHSESIDGDVGGNNGSNDFWIVKLAPENLSTTTPENQTISVYPNPVQDILYINAVNPIQKAEVFDIQGRLLLEVTLNTMNAEIPIEHLKAGNYLISVLVENTRATYQFLKK